MNIYSIYLRDEWVATIDGLDYVCEVWVKVRELAELLSVRAFMVYDKTGEVVAECEEPENYDCSEPDDIDDDCGFDPYEGCYTYDC